MADRYFSGLAPKLGGSFAMLLVALVAACAGGNTDGKGSTAPASKNGLTTDGGAAADGGKTEERAFAGSTAEATSLISAVVDKRGTEIGLCVRDFRVRKKLARERVSVSFGIDMEGTLLGVTSKGKEDAELKQCVQDALKGAPFPRSHAGVITVTKTYEELLQ
jgi:hypothetical protein